MKYCDECKVESIRMGYTKPCQGGVWVYELDGGKCDRCGKKADVFDRPEMVLFATENPVINKKQ